MEDDYKPLTSFSHRFLRPRESKLRTLEKRLRDLAITRYSDDKSRKITMSVTEFIRDVYSQIEFDALHSQFGSFKCTVQQALYLEMQRTGHEYYIQRSDLPILSYIEKHYTI